MYLSDRREIVPNHKKSSVIENDYHDWSWLASIDNDMVPTLQFNSQHAKTATFSLPSKPVTIADVNNNYRCLMILIIKNNYS